MPKPPIPSFEDEIRADLQKGEITVRFLKVTDGKAREMRCTTSPALIPPAILSKTTKNTPTPGLVVVWDLDKKGWRSFYIDAVEYLRIDADAQPWKRQAVKS